MEASYAATHRLCRHSFDRESIEASSAATRRRHSQARVTCARRVPGRRHRRRGPRRRGRRGGQAGGVGPRGDGRGEGRGAGAGDGPAVVLDVEQVPRAPRRPGAPRVTSPSHVTRPRPSRDPRRPGASGPARWCHSVQGVQGVRGMYVCRVYAAAACTYVGCTPRRQDAPPRAPSPDQSQA
jgi:hypothetical protein